MFNFQIRSLFSLGIICFFIFAGLSFGTSPVQAADNVSANNSSNPEETSGIPVAIDGLKVELDTEPVILNNRTFVPFRGIAEALNVNVTWDGSTRTVHAENKEVSVRLQIDSSTAYVNDSAEELDAAPVIINDRTLIPLRFFSEAFGCEVEWLGKEEGVKIISPPLPMNIVGFYALGDRQTSSWVNLFREEYPETTQGNTDAVSELALGWYSLDEEGNLLTSSGTGWQRPPGWENVLVEAERYNLRTEMVVHRTDGDGKLSEFLADEDAVEKFVQEVVDEADLYDGINLNLEELGRIGEDAEDIRDTRDNFTEFVEMLSEEMEQGNKTLTLTIHPPNSSYRGYDYTTLGQAADRIIIMAHEYGPKPEPVDRVMEAVEMTKEDVPSHKIMLAVSIPNETPESMITKMGIAKRYELEGISLWRLGLLTEEMWNTLRTHAIVNP